jgi:LmbE family N-acetylglucosaminyl deacetylase
MPEMLRMLFENVERLLVFVAHPDDETIGCAGLLQRVPASLVVFAVDGSPAGYGFERKFGTLKNYSEERFREAGRALGYTPNCEFRRLKTRRGEYFQDRRLFENLEEAAGSLLTTVQEFSPDAMVSHAFEGGHIDHDACSFLANHAASSCGLRHLEFPLYWKGANGQDVFQEFREVQGDEVCLDLSEAEITVKKKMLGEYKSQGEIVATFSLSAERFRGARSYDYVHPRWNFSYPGNWRTRRDARLVLKRFEEFRGMTVKKGQ